MHVYKRGQPDMGEKIGGRARHEQEADNWKEGGSRMASYQTGGCGGRQLK